MERAEVDVIARVALLFLNGDDFERLLIDQRQHTDYRFDEFNRLKEVLLKAERFCEGADVAAILWRQFPGNPYVAEPLVAGSALPNTGWRRVRSGPEMRLAFHGERTAREWPGAGCSFYYPLKNSDEEIVGVLELLVDRGWRKDVDTTEMFVEPLEPEDDGEE